MSIRARFRLESIVDAQVSDQGTSDECAQPQPCASLCSKTFISIVKHWTVANLRTERVLILELGTHIEWLRWGLNGQRVGGGQEQRELKERCAWMVARATRSGRDRGDGLTQTSRLGNLCMPFCDPS